MRPVPAKTLAAAGRQMWKQPLWRRRPQQGGPVGRPPL